MRIYLRPVTEKDGANIVKWRNNPTILSHCMNQARITIESNNLFFENKVKTGKYIQYIVERIDDTYGVSAYPIATVYLKDIDRLNRRCQLCIFTSDDEEWNNESQSMAIKMLLKEAFNKLNMHKVYSYVIYKFVDEIELLKNSGFSVEAVLKGEVKNTNGEFEDIIRFSIFKSEWLQ